MDGLFTYHQELEPTQQAQLKSKKDTCKGGEK